ncbi:MAG TPA: hypothetical protein VMC79_09850, partial [Rectinemataceae bacterium]|nr:hypothetical protein [Rectinemataceae bacterium]
MLVTMSALFLAAFTFAGYLITKTLTADGQDRATRLAQLNGQAVARLLTSAADTARGLGADIEALRSEGVRDRKVLLHIVRSTLALHADFLATWAIFEPNAWDRGGGGGEQFVPYAWRKGGTIDVSDSDSAEDYAGELAKDYYALPKSSDSPVLLEPYSDQTETGTFVLETSLCVPLHDAAGAFIGVCGVDVSLDRLSEMVSSLTLFKTGTFTVLSPGGLIVASPDKKKLMTKLSDSAGPELVSAANGVMSNSLPVSLRGSALQTIEPIAVPGVAHPWALIASVPLNEVQRDARNFVFILIAVCLLSLLLVTLVLVGFVTRISLPIGRISLSFTRLAA